MHEHEDVTLVTLTPEREERVAAMLQEISEAEGEVGVDDEAVQAALDEVLRWFLMEQRKVKARALARRNLMSDLNRRTNNVFDWRNGVEGEILQERIALLQRIEYSMLEMLAIYDEISTQGPVSEYIEGFSECRLSGEFAPPRVESFKRPILKILQLMRGGGKAKTVLQVMRETVADQTTDTDFLRLATPYITSQQWRAIAYRAAAQLDKAGFIVRENGEWAITREGENFLDESK